MREVRDQLRDRRTLFMITILPVLLYPMLGLGLVEMMLTFSEQHRTVVILNASELPGDPSFLADGEIDARWLESGKDRTPVSVITDQAESHSSPLAHSSGDDPTPHGLLEQAEILAFHVRNAIATRAAAGTVSNSAEIGRQANNDLISLFNESGIDVLVLVPDGYSDAVASVRQQIRNGAAEPAATQSPSGLIVVRNSADDKSVVAFSIVQSALRSWESNLRRSMFDEASLPEALQHPARLQWVEVAGGEQVAANVWSKLFPAMLVIMTLTGAFYPAIDLGAGEKERGTMETLLISPARRVELVLGKFCTIMLFSVCSALMNLASMAITGHQMASSMGGGLTDTISLQFPPASAIIWVVISLLPLAALFSALCLALATFARSTKEGQNYLTPLLMVIMGLTMFCLWPSVEIAPLYSVLPVLNVALLLKGLLLTSTQSGSLMAYAIPVLVSSFGYSLLAIWWAIELYNNETVLFREAEKFDLRTWLKQLARPKDAVPAFPEAVFCFVGLLVLQLVAITWLRPDLSGTEEQRALSMLKLICVQQLVTIACPAVFMGIILTTSPRATFRLRRPSSGALLSAAGLAVAVHPLSIELSRFLAENGVFPDIPDAIARVHRLMSSETQPLWVLIAVFALTPAICEELAFRGFILSGLARGGRLAVAIVISSVMFGVIHMIPQQVFNATLVGLLIGLVAIHSRSLFPVILFHFITNTLALLHSRNMFPLPKGMLFGRDESEQLQYHSPVLIVCSVIVVIACRVMIRDLMRQQEARRRGDLKPYVDKNTVSVST
ncbi:MAG: ABC transporter permease subunit [Fuerstiella sp.]|nr:ABC transporter permease subunit [Fuerstiella sp.]